VSETFTEDELRVAQAVCNDRHRSYTRDGTRFCGRCLHTARIAIRAMQPAPLPVVTPSAGWADGEKFAKE
jgi:hypothetical protein